MLLNQKLNPTTLENESDKQKLMVLLRTFFEVHKGWHIQYNIVSRETLLDAKKHPDQYRDLVVRVAGYSAFFTALSPDAQDDIIARNRTYAVIYPGAIGNMSELPDGATFNRPTQAC
ncbi:4-hydroxyphenylacetate decarboxylase large subunit [Salmonella enterica subsp. enterica]|nr:4-hydroxyphenylacetate decarboxylase large subunit [Salmonella enterica subsp. enterica]